jgi:putative peptidoglycan lipid II flippase
MALLSVLLGLGALAASSLGKPALLLIPVLAVCYALAAWHWHIVEARMTWELVLNFWRKHRATP